MGANLFFPIFETTVFNGAFVGLIDRPWAFQIEVPEATVSSDPGLNKGARELRLANSEFEYSLLTGYPL